jgi:hypothetical protein
MLSCVFSPGFTFWYDGMYANVQCIAFSCMHSQRCLNRSCAPQRQALQPGTRNGPHRSICLGLRPTTTVRQQVRSSSFLCLLRLPTAAASDTVCNSRNSPQQQTHHPAAVSLCVPGRAALQQPTTRCHPARTAASTRFLLHNEPRKRRNWHRLGKQQNPTGRHVCGRWAHSARRLRKGEAVMAEPPPPCGIVPFAISGENHRTHKHLPRASLWLLSCSQLRPCESRNGRVGLDAVLWLHCFKIAIRVLEY